MKIVHDDKRPYLRSEHFCWYDKRTDKKDIDFGCYKDCYVFTDLYFTFGACVKPEFQNISQEKRQQIYKKTHEVMVGFDGNFTFSEISEKNITFFEEQISKTEKFFEKINNGEVPKYNRAVMNVDKFAILYKDFESPLVYVNAQEILDPSLNLLDNLMDCCCLSNKDEVRYYFDEDDEILYVSWWEEESQRDYFVMGIKPIAFVKDEGGYLERAFNEINKLANCDCMQYKTIAGKAATNA